jgi:hypothetical protein
MVPNPLAYALAISMQIVDEKEIGPAAIEKEPHADCNKNPVGPPKAERRSSCEKSFNWPFASPLLFSSAAAPKTTPVLNLVSNGPQERLNYLASLSNRAVLVNDIFGPCAGIRVVSAVGTKPPHDGRSRVRPPRVLRAVRNGRNEATGMALPTSRQGHRNATS